MNSTMLATPPPPKKKTAQYASFQHHSKDTSEIAPRVSHWGKRRTTPLSLPLDHHMKPPIRMGRSVRHGKGAAAA